MSPEYSQVLLENNRYIHQIVNQVPESSFGVEWAPGKGALTRELSDLWDYVFGIEIDPGYCRALRAQFPPSKVGIVRTDLLRYPFPDRDRSIPLVGNLPYHITGPALMKILDISQFLTSFTGLVQWEVAERLQADSGHSEYGSLTLLFKLIGSTEIVTKVPPEAFNPEPEVHSGLVHFEPNREINDLEAHKTLARHCFQHPRKTLINNLAAATGNKDVWRERFQELHWDLKRRPQTLTPEDFEEVFTIWTSLRS